MSASEKEAKHNGEAATAAETDPKVTFNTMNSDLSIGKGKSLSLLRELTSSWSSEPVCVKYSLKDDGDFGDCGGSQIRQVDSTAVSAVPVAAAAPSSAVSGVRNNCAVSGRPALARAAAVIKPNFDILFADENWKKRRAQLLRQCSEYLELESINSKYSKENFRRGFLNKVSTM